MIFDKIRIIFNNSIYLFKLIYEQLTGSVNFALEMIGRNKRITFIGKSITVIK
jgi:hypothetical protein